MKASLPFLQGAPGELTSILLGDPGMGVILLTKPVT